MTTLLLERFNYAPAETFGRITLPDGRQFFTCEQPWNGNKTGQSCIPEGVYDLQLRESPVVFRTSGGEFDTGYEVMAVQGRSFIMIHPANWADELRGCISVGHAYAIMPKSGKHMQAVTSSRNAFRELMAALASYDELQIDIRQWRPEFP